MRFWESYDAAHWYHPQATLNWERLLLLCGAPNLYLPQPAMTTTTPYDDDTLYVNAKVKTWYEQNGIIAALRDTITPAVATHTAPSLLYSTAIYPSHRGPTICKPGMSIACLLRVPCHGAGCELSVRSALLRPN